MLKARNTKFIQKKIQNQSNCLLSLNFFLTYRVKRFPVRFMNSSEQLQLRPTKNQTIKEKNFYLALQGGGIIHRPEQLKQAADSNLHSLEKSEHEETIHIFKH